MMTLRRAAHVFDKQTFQDAYGSAVFKGQVLPYPDSTRSGSATRRRILEVDMSVKLPDKLTIKELSSDQVYIVSGPAYDFYGGDVVRKKYPVLPVDNVGAILTVDQLLSGVGGERSVYISASYIRRAILEDQSEYEGGFELHFSRYFSAPANSIVTLAGRYYKVRETSRIDDIGLGVAEAVELPEPISVVNFQAGGSTMNPATGSMVSPAPVTGVSILSIPAFLSFKNEALGFEKIEAGDTAVSFLKSAVPAVKAGDKIGGRRIISVSNMGLFWNTHTRAL